MGEGALSGRAREGWGRCHVSLHDPSVWVGSGGGGSPRQASRGQGRPWDVWTQVGPPRLVRKEKREGPSRAGAGGCAGGGQGGGLEARPG